ncbi:MAG: polysaccharide lyase family 7 protein [Beijerinckiaceae bacterium]|nr:polysaccharide lyase family 7 protein [Beijerinckiaceae bacterium]
MSTPPLDRRALLALGVGLLAGPAVAATPGERFALSGWKLQLPGPREITALAGFESRDFRLDDEGRLVFAVDAAETGSTPNSQFVRSELRHMAEWPVTVPLARLSARFAMIANPAPPKVTVMQVHGVGPGGSNMPPLLRIAVNGGDLRAFIKRDANGRDTESVLLLRGLNAGETDVEIVMAAGRLRIAAAGAPAVERDVRFWPARNYFKLGCYPQAHRGDASVAFARFDVTVG